MIEPQLEDRIYGHMLAYSKNFIEKLIAKIIANNKFIQVAVDQIDDVNTNHLIEETN